MDELQRQLTDVNAQRGRLQTENGAWGTSQGHTAASGRLGLWGVWPGEWGSAGQSVLLLPWREKLVVPQEGFLAGILCL